MSAEAMTNAALMAAAGVAALAGDRIYPDVLPQGKPLPALVYVRKETEYITTIHSNAPIGAEVLMEVWCFAASRAGADALADAAQAAVTSAGFVLGNRRPEFDMDTDTYASVVPCIVGT